MNVGFRGSVTHVFSCVNQYQMADLFDSARIGETLNTKDNHFDMTSVVLMSIRNLMPKWKKVAVSFDD